MHIQLIIIILLLLLLIATCSILKREFSFFCKYQNARILNSITISETYDDLKSGDIILFKSNAISFSSAIFTHIYYSHIGIVVRGSNLTMQKLPGDPHREYINELYISETNPSFEYLPIDYANKNNWYGLNPNLKNNSHNGWKTKYGTDLLPLLVRIKYYPGDSFLMRLNKKLDPERESLLIKHCQERCPYPSPLQGAKILIEEKFGKQRTYARHCYQHVANILDKINITNNILSENTCLSICDKITYIPEKELNDGYKYEIPIKLLYDI